MPPPLRRLILVLGDQLDREHPLLRAAEPARDALWMAEVPAESRRIPSHAARTTLFLAAMRHFAADCEARGWTVHYRQLGQHDAEDLPTALARDLVTLSPEQVAWLRPGEYGIRQALHATTTAAGLTPEEHEPTHFIDTPAAFAAFAGHRAIRQETYYRHLRRRTGVLMNGNEPAGGRWNFDADNRASFGREGPGLIPAPRAFPPDAVTRRARADVATYLPDLPGSAEGFDWPVTPAEAEQALTDFTDHRLPDFGRYQDAMWTGHGVLYHARISAALNLQLLDPRRAIAAAETAWQEGRAPLAAVEGFIRQILGWREYVRGIYWQRMPDYLDANALGADQPLPALYWTGETDMNCLREVVGQVLATGYAHHIQRLMVTGLFALLAGIRPREVHEWYLGMFVDAVEWVEAPNTLGMALYADGGALATKPYAASGRYIQRMSNYCRGCRFRPDRRTGEEACPFTTLYWAFLDRHEARFANHPRMGMAVKNLRRLYDGERHAIRERAAALRSAPP
ncbi:deoxyribodipyrimidine photolyase-related protein [Thiohalospira halophila DSM 15071]|uniref:Deoxyribodipyrimidine photolyase-related protein n=1 Tax=Thiohalospira halophila DSM 15071 TaxID=1123397 RepID=A0A1I1WI12_9GAMM|nr:cryptochrome/photolyase family protein [Thiohalospira halophila]SFD94844.1 deoxyribodipyrimidine photolyase-related protein [Thiohalospira halophila DSM 15071]